MSKVKYKHNQDLNKRYWLFSDSSISKNGGLHDVIFTFKSFDELLEYFEKNYEIRAAVTELHDTYLNSTIDIQFIFKKIDGEKYLIVENFGCRLIVNNHSQFEALFI